jgi:branched-chain amino acid transport system substrate-binding protein
MRRGEANPGSEPWRVGVLFSQSGVMAISEQTQLRGTLLAIDEINEASGVNGREIRPVVYDPASENSLYRYYAKKMLIEDGVTTILGCYTSSSRKAVLPIMERLNGLLLYPTLYEGFEYSPSVIYTGAAPNQNSYALAEFLTNSCGRRFYFVGSDYVYPRETNRIMRELLKTGGAEVVGEAYLPTRAAGRAFKPVINDIKAASPDAIFSTVVGRSTVYLYQAYADAGFDSKKIPIASLTTTEAEIRAMGYDVGEGHITSAPYFQNIDGELNDLFVRRYKKRFGEDEPTTMGAEAAYFQVHMLARALEESNTMDPDLLRPAILRSEFDAPQGPISMNASCNHANLWSRIGRVNRLGQFEVLRQSKESVAADPFLTGAPAALPVT